MSWHAIVLAAGAGRRFGGSKLTAPFGDGVVLDGALRVACAAPVASVFVVVGAHAAAVRAAVDHFVSAVPIMTICCADHAEGMAASLRTGIGALPEGARGAVILLGDMPKVPNLLVAELIALGEAGAAAAAPVSGGRRGHPILISRALFPDFSGLTGDAGGRGILNRLGADLALVETDDPGIFSDVDKPEDLLRR